MTVTHTHVLKIHSVPSHTHLYALVSLLHGRFGELEKLDAVVGTARCQDLMDRVEIQSRHFLEQKHNRQSVKIYGE